MQENHVIQGKWVDCKSAIPVNEMKLIQSKDKDPLSPETIIDIMPVPTPSPITN